MMLPVSPIGEEEFTGPRAGAARRVAVGRLEFGKFCVSRDGPIEDMAGHRQLGSSYDFPRELVPFCDPTIIGISSGNTEYMSAAHWEYGTILRPVVLPSREVRSVLCRVRTRPEDGEEGTARLYTLARYLVAPDEGVHPATLLQAMDSLTTDRGTKRLPGLTRRDQIEPLSAINSRPAFAPGSPTERFLRGALVYILSGIPVCITEKVSEEEFFNWVAALWHALPPALRPLLSAGWQVEASFAGQLAVIYTSQAAPNCALFSPSASRRTGEKNWAAERENEEGKYGWTSPSVFITLKNGRFDRSEFSKSRLVAGFMYAHHVFGSAVDELPFIDELLLIDGKQTESSMEELTKPWLSSVELKELPDFLDPVTISAFRYPGVRAVNLYRLKLLRDWLDTGAGFEAKYFKRDAKEFTYQEFQRAALCLAVQSLDVEAHGDLKKRARGDAAIWDSFAQKPKKQLPQHFCDLVKRSRCGGSYRARLLAVMQSDNHASVLRMLLKKPARTGGAGWLSDEIRSALHYHLSSTLGVRELLARHEKLLLRKKDAPEEYLNWVRLNAFDLLISMLKILGSIEGAAAKRVRDLAPSPDVKLLCRWAEGKEPTEGDRAVLASLNEERMGRLLELVVREWGSEREGIRERREFLLKWLLMDVPAWRLWIISTETFSSNPVLALAFRRALTPREVKPLEEVAVRRGWSSDIVRRAASLAEGNFDESQIRTLVYDVKRRAVPKSLEYEMGLLMLRQWPSIEDYVPGGEGIGAWLPFINWWVDDTALALMKVVNGARQKAITPEMRQEDERFAPPAHELDSLMRDWYFMADLSESQRVRMAKRYWAWAARPTPGRRVEPSLQHNSTAFDLCRDLATRCLATQAPPAERGEDFNITLRIIIESGAEAELKRESQRFWEAALHPWHLRLLLSLFPSENFQPTPRQLSRLVYYRRWLKAHLESCPPTGVRRRKFGVAAKEFHEVPFHGRAGEPRWDNIYSDYAIWGAFAGVPAGFGVNLAQALYAYDPTGQQHMSMCVDHLLAYKDRTTRDYAHAVSRVLNQILLPKLARYHDQKWIEKLFSRVYEDESSDGSSILPFRKARKVVMEDPAMHAVIIEIVRSRDLVSGIVKEFFESRKR